MAIVPVLTRPRSLLPDAQPRAITDTVNQILKTFGASTVGLGGFADVGNGSSIWRFADKVFVDAGVAADGTTTGGNTYVGSNASDAVMGAQYIERASSTFSPSSRGGIGVTGASRLTDQYAYYSATVWTSGASVSTGDKRGYARKVYVAASSGTTGASPPTHSSGTVSDGAVNWTFSTHTYLTPIGIVGIAMDDASDSGGAWAGYFELQRTANGGTGFGIEIAVKNRAGDVTSDPYGALAAGISIGALITGGADDTYGGAAANPSGAGITFIKNAKTWNSGIVFASDAITLDGSSRGYAVKLAAGHMMAWYGAAGQLGARIWSSNTTNSTDCGLEFLANTVRFIGSGGTIIGQVENVASAANYLRLISQTTTNAPELRAGGSDTDIDLALTAKGTGVLKFGTRTAIGVETVTGYITIKDSGGTSRKLAVVS